MLNFFTAVLVNAVDIVLLVVNAVVVVYFDIDAVVAVDVDTIVDVHVVVDVDVVVVGGGGVDVVVVVVYLDYIVFIFICCNSYQAALVLTDRFVPRDPKKEQSPLKLFQFLFTVLFPFSVIFAFYDLNQSYTSASPTPFLLRFSVSFK